MLNELWTEKYRPKKLSDIILPKSIKNNIEYEIKNNKLPHYIFIGKPGTGKTSLALVIIKELNAHSLILNASDERGIDTIRNKVGNFVKIASDKPKIVFLDEADNLTSDAQTSLRNIMETYSKYCRFIFTGNYDKFIEPIKDRCKVVVFNHTKETCYFILKKIIDKENIIINDNELNIIIDKFFPSVRKMITILQINVVNDGNKLIFKLPDRFDDDTGDVITKIWNFFIKKDVIKIRETISNHGISDFIPLYKYFFEQFIDKNRELYALITSEYMYRDSFVADKEINFISMLYSIYNRALPFVIVPQNYLISQNVNTVNNNNNINNTNNTNNNSTNIKVNNTNKNNLGNVNNFGNIHNKDSVNSFNSKNNSINNNIKSNNNLDAITNINKILTKKKNTNTIDNVVNSLKHF